MDLIGKRGGGAGGKANSSASRSTKGMRLRAGIVDVVAGLIAAANLVDLW
jgi:hypothetical protein